jgi:outer membrane lipoprotein-sorting protein
LNKKGSGSFLEKRTKKLLCLFPLVASACMGTPKPQFSAADENDIQRVGSYLNATTRFEAHFSQTGAFGVGAGLVWLDRPGHLRIDYEGPASRLMVISNGRVRMIDRATGGTSSMPLSRTPLAILLAPDITLSGPVTVAALHHDLTGLQLTLQKTDQPSQGSLTLYLSDMPLHLNAVTVTDAYQRSLTLRLSDMNPNPVLTPDLFKPPTPPGGS